MSNLNIDESHVGDDDHSDYINGFNACDDQDGLHDDVKYHIPGTY